MNSSGSPTRRRTRWRAAPRPLNVHKRGGHHPRQPRVHLPFERDGGRGVACPGRVAGAKTWPYIARQVMPSHPRAGQRPRDGQPSDDRDGVASSRPRPWEGAARDRGRHGRGRPVGGRGADRVASDGGPAAGVTGSGRTSRTGGRPPEAAGPQCAPVAAAQHGAAAVDRSAAPGVAASHPATRRAAGRTRRRRRTRRSRSALQTTRAASRAFPPMGTQADQARHHRPGRLRAAARATCATSRARTTASGCRPS